MEFVAIFSYLAVAFLVVMFSIKLSNYVDLLDKKTNISGAFLGGILLAAVTSLPELFTSLTATAFIKDNHLVLGNILGSDLFNLTLFAIIYIFFFGKLLKAKVGKNHLISILFVGILYVLVTIGSFVFDYRNILWGWFNPVSIAVVAVYALSVIKTPATDEAQESETDSALTVKQIVARFVLFALGLVGASIGMTYLVDWIVNLFKIGPTFGGALFLGVATSLPEMTATITLSKKKNFNAAFGNILGSCVFNFIILALGDILSWNCKDAGGSYLGIYKIDQSAFLLLICGALALLIAFITVFIKVKGKIKDTKKYKVLYITSGAIIAGLYITFLILSNINLGLSFAPYMIA